MQAPPPTPYETKQILLRTIREYMVVGLDWDTAVTATAEKYGATEYKVAALVEAERPARPVLVAK